MNNHTPVPQTSIPRFKQVYVEIPPSPFHSSRINELTPPAHVQPIASGNLKENTPLRPTHGRMTQQIAAIASHKRKLSDCEVSTSMVVSNAKKAKFATSSGTKKQAKPSATVGTMPTATAFPNGFIYCHQCSKKRDIDASIQCTLKGSHTTAKDKVTKERRCHNKFCKSCLKNRYGEDVDEIKTNASPSKEKGHVDGEGYTFTCPKCRDMCNCARCRKAKGLEPTGNLTNAVRKAGAGSAAEVLVGDPKVAGVLPGKGIQTVPPEPKKPRPKPKPQPKTVSANIIVKSDTKVKSTNTKKSKQKPLPILKWNRLRVNLSLSDAEARFQIREFMLRFAAVMDTVIAKTHLEELEDIGGKGRGRDDDDKMAGWVSEACVKSIVLGLLGLLANDEEGDIEKALKTAIKEIRACGANLNKIWAVLSALRESLGGSGLGSESSDTSDSEIILTFPDPLPPPVSTIVYNTRNTRSSKVTSGEETSVYVVNSAQMVPVLVALTDAALETEYVREEIDRGVKDGREKVREARENGKKEHERWEKEKKDMESAVKDKEREKEAKDRRNSHKQNTQDLNSALKIAMYGYAPRSGPLGSDSEGRIYWALSPGVAERDCALELVTSMTGETGDGKGNEEKSRKGQGRRRGRARGGEERSMMREWSWFVGVWGKRPAMNPGETVVRASEKKDTSKGNIDDSDSDSESSDEEDEDKEKWWGFWEPEEIRKVAEWIEVKSGLDQDDQTSEGSGASSPVSEMTGHGSHKDSTISSDLHGDITMANTGSPSKVEMKALVKGLNEYAAVLEWRVKKEENAWNDRQDENDGDGDDVDRSTSKSKGKATAVVAAGNFYK